MDIKTIAFLGTSLTAGTGAVKGSWVGGLGQTLSPGKSSRLRLVNTAEGGYSSADGLTIIARSTGIKADIALVEFLTNDCETTRAMSVAQSRANHITIIAALRAARPDIRIFLMTMNPVISGSNRTNLPAYNQMYRDLAPLQNVGLIDIYPSWGTPNETQIPGGLHPTLEANMAITVPAIAAVLAPLLS